MVKNAQIPKKFKCDILSDFQTKSLWNYEIRSNVSNIIWPPVVKTYDVQTRRTCGSHERSLRVTWNQFQICCWSNNMSISQDFRKDFECPVCLEVPKSTPIFQCDSGHIHCNICHPKLQNCPICRIELGNFHLLTLT